MTRDKPNHVVLLVTASCNEEAHKIAHALLSQKKAACVNIVPQINSFFLWRGVLDSAQENLLIIKTKAPLLDPAIKIVKEIHGYEIPEIIALPITNGNPDYLEWIDSELRYNK